MNTIRLIALGLVALGAGLLGQSHHTAFADGEYGTLYIDVVPDGDNTTEGFGPIDVCRDTDDLGGPLDVGDTFIIDILIDDAPQILGAGFTLDYKGTDMPPAVLKVMAYAWFNWKFGSGVDMSDTMPDIDGAFSTSYEGTSTSGDGVIQRITLQAVGSGQSDLTLTNVAVIEDGLYHHPPEVLYADPVGIVRVVVGGFCPAATPTPPPAVGGIAELPAASGSSARNYIALAGLAAAALVALTGGALYARRRWVR